MAQATQIYILTDATSVTSSLCKSRFDPLVPAQFPESIFGDQRLIEVYLVRSDYTYDTRSGSATVTPRLALARKSKAATGGVFDLTFGANTASGLAYNITAAALETALNALASITSAGGVDVSGAAGGPFTVTWRSNGARALMTGTSIDLTPSSSMAINQVTAGDVSTRAVQSIRIQTRVVALVDSWTIKLDPTDGVTPIGWTATLDTRSVDMLEMLEGADTAAGTIEFEVTEGGAKTTLTQQDCTIIKDIITDASTTPHITIAFATIADIDAAVLIETNRATAAEALKANIASPVFTGNPTAPTPSTTDNDTSIATTAMVQSVQQAEWTQPTAISITAAGNSNVAAVSAQNRYLTQRVDVTAFTGTATITLQSASALSGDKRRFIVAMPAGVSNLIELRNLTSGGTLLATVPMDGALARDWVGYSTFDGTNWGAVSFSPMSVNEFVVSRTAFRGDYIQSDGATSNRAAGIYGPFDATNNPREWVAGAASLTDVMVITVPTASSTAEIVGRSSSTTALSSATAWSMSVAWSGNDLVIRCNGATPATDFRTVTFTGLRTTYSGQTIFAKSAFTNGTTTPVLIINGGTISGTTANGGGTTPDWLSASLVPTYRLVGYNWPSGPAPIVTPILGATSAADDAFYMQTGKWPAWVVAGGNGLNSITSISRNSDFSAGVTDWSAVSATVSIASGALRIETAVTDGRAQLAGSFLNEFILTGVAYRLTFDVTAYSVISGSPTMRALIGVTDQIFGTITGVGLFTGTLISTSTVPVSTNLQVRQNGAGAMDVSIDNVKLTRLGALSLSSVQPINVMDDVSSIGGNQGRLLGCMPVTDKTDWRISANTWTSGNQQILAGSIIDSTKDVIELVEQSTTGTPTTTIGSASAGAQYKASSALTAGINTVTIVTRKLASNDVWVNSTSTAVVRTTITGHRAA